MHVAAPFKYRDHIAISVHIYTHTPSVSRVNTIKDHNQSIVTNLFVTITHRDSEHDWLHHLIKREHFPRFYFASVISLYHFCRLFTFFYCDLVCNSFSIFCFVSFLERAICFSLFFFLLEILFRILYCLNFLLFEIRSCFNGLYTVEVKIQSPEFN